MTPSILIYRYQLSLPTDISFPLPICNLQMSVDWCYCMIFKDTQTWNALQPVQNRIKSKSSTPEVNENEWLYTILHFYSFTRYNRITFCFIHLKGIVWVSFNFFSSSGSCMSWYRTVASAHCRREMSSHDPLSQSWRPHHARHISNSYHDQYNVTCSVTPARAGRSWLLIFSLLHQEVPLQFPLFQNRDFKALILKN